jgi:hypothetical protein
VTVSVEAPPRNLYDVPNWLTHRHLDLLALCDRVGAVDQATGVVDPAKVRDSVISFDAFHRDRDEHNRKNRLKSTDEIESMSITLGPQPAPRAVAMLTMLPAQIASLRLVATMAPAMYGVCAEWCADMLILVDPAVVRDWVEAMSIYSASSWSGRTATA